jgi:hypothetical protein
MTIQAFKRRFDELLVQVDDLENAKWTNSSGRDYVDDEVLLGWRVKVRNLLSQACGEKSEHYQQFVQVEGERVMMSTNHDQMKRLKAVFLAAKEDYEGGYTRSTRSLVHAELFEDELEQAKELLAQGYKAASAVVAGVVLETTLRKLCGDKGIPVKTLDGKPVKLDKMNADLAKDGLYDKLVMKRVTMLADIRCSSCYLI